MMRQPGSIWKKIHFKNPLWKIHFGKWSFGKFILENALQKLKSSRGTTTVNLTVLLSNQLVTHLYHLCYLSLDLCYDHYPGHKEKQLKQCSTEKPTFTKKYPIFVTTGDCVKNQSNVKFSMGTSRSNQRNRFLKQTVILHVFASECLLFQRKLFCKFVHFQA